MASYQRSQWYTCNTKKKVKTMYPVYVTYQVCAFMGCCDSIPQICFKVAVTAFDLLKTNWNRVCVCAFMGRCDSIPQICFKVAVTAFVENKLKQGVCVCVHLGVAVTASLRFVLKLHGQYFFKTNWNRVCVCVYSWVAVTAPLNVKALKCSFCFWVRVVQQQHYLKHV